MASESPSLPRGNAFDKEHHPGNPGLNFIPLYVTIVAVFLASICVKVMTVILKKQRDKKRDPDIERQTMDLFERMWFPWRYDKHGRKKKLPRDPADGTSDGTSSGTASPALMTGALSPNSLPSPIRLDTMSSRLSRASVGDMDSLHSSPDHGKLDATARAACISDSDSISSRSRLPVVNPFTSKPFRSSVPHTGSSSSSSSSWTPTKSSQPKGVGKEGYGNLGSLPNEGNRIDDDSFVDIPLGAHEEELSHPQPEPAVERQDFAHGYGASTGKSSAPDDHTHKRFGITSAPSKDKSQSTRTPSTLDKKPAVPKSTKKQQPADSKDTSSRMLTSSRRAGSSSSGTVQFLKAAPPARQSPSSSRSGAPSSSRVAPSSSLRSQQSPSSSSSSSASSLSRGAASSSSTAGGAPNPAITRTKGALGGGKFKGVVMKSEDKAAFDKEKKAKVKDETIN